MAMYTDFVKDFALRTKENLLNIESTKASSISFHEVTNLINSCLGMIVFIKERKKLPKCSVNSFFNESRIVFNKDKYDSEHNIQKFIASLRNAISHCRINPYGKDGNIEGFDFSDAKKGRKAHWECSIDNDSLRNIALKLANYVSGEASN